jgi:hypothetical protein
MKYKQILFTVILVVILSTFLSVSAKAQTSSPINAAVKISVCGNGIIENGEDCEGANLNNKTCQSLGYSGGTLSCDISCSFVTTQCIAATPTPTPTSVPTPTPTAIPNPTATPTQSPTQTPAPTITASQVQIQTYSLTPIPTPTPTPSPVPTKQPSIIKALLPKAKSFPKALLAYGAGKDGMIPKSKLKSSVKSWVADWQNFLASAQGQNGKGSSPKCDINGDGVCDIDDFSILLSYVQP